MYKKMFSTLKLLRPRQWVKNFAIFASVIFSGQLFNLNVTQYVIVGFFVFCGISSATYVINDILDIEKDRLHPFKRFRPLAKGDISINSAVVLSLFLIICSLFLASFVNFAFLVFVIVYLFIQIFYSTLLKKIAIIDILVIASGYILRVLGGEFATGFHISVWLLLTTISISLFLAIGKRRSELTLLSSRKEANIAATRLALSHYSERLLDVYASVFATGTFIFYSLFTFLENPHGSNFPLGDIIAPDILPAAFQRKWLMITIIPVVYGLMRYLQDIYEKNEGESPEKVLFSDKPLLFDVLLWGLMVIFVIYFINS